MERRRVFLVLSAFVLTTYELVSAQQPTTTVAWTTTPNATDLKCGHVHDVNRSEQCNFVKTTRDCEIQGGYIDYIRLPYCYLHGSIAGAVILYLLWISYLFINVALTVKSFLYPSLDAISKILRLSESVAGVTFLALGNGAADIFSLIVLMAKEDRDGSYAETAMGGIMGGGLFVTSVVVGLICFNYELRVKPVPFLRDVLFYLAAVTWLLVMVIDGKIIVGEAIGFICLYVLYVSFVLLSLRLERKSKDREEKQPLLFESGGVSEETTFHDQTKETTTEQTNDKVPDEGLLGDGETEDMADSSCEKSLDSTTSLVTKRNQYYEFVKVLWPYSMKNFLKLKWYSKIIVVLQMPLRLLLTLTIPVVNYSETNFGWNRMLIMFNIILGPALTAIAFDFFFKPAAADYLLVGLIILGVSVILALLIALASYSDYPPRYYGGFSFLGFLMSIVWIYIITSEVVNVLEAASIILQLSRALVGLLILAFGNSVCDLVANFVVAKQGKAIMGFSACYGSPLLNMLIGISLGFFIAIAKHEGTYTVKMTPQLGVAAGFLIGGLVIAITVVVSRKWTASRLLGIILPTLYAVFVIVLLCVEFIP